MKRLRNEVRWWLHGVADVFYLQALKWPMGSRIGGWWCRLSGWLDRVALRIGGAI